MYDFQEKARFARFGNVHVKIPLHADNTSYLSLSLSLFLSLVGNVPIRLTANNTGLGMKRRG